MDSTQAIFHSSDTLCWRDDAKVTRFLFVKIETDSLESSEATDGNVSWISRPQSYTLDRLEFTIFVKYVLQKGQNMCHHYLQWSPCSNSKGKVSDQAS